MDAVMPAISQVSLQTKPCNTKIAIAHNEFNIPAQRRVAAVS